MPEKRTALSSKWLRGNSGASGRGGPCCGYRGRFQLEPHLLTAESCLVCGVLERQRLFALAMQRGFVTLLDADVLQFAPDPLVTALVDGSVPY